MPCCPTHESKIKGSAPFYFEVLFDDRNERPGVMFNDMELIGIPHRIVIGERGLDKGEIEYKYRRDENAQNIPETEFMDFLLGKLSGH